MNFRTLCLPLLFTSSLVLNSHGGNWPNWRGPNFNGTGAEDEKDLPVKFSPTEGVAWTADLPGPAASTPVVWGDSVFVTAAVESEKKLYAFCLDGKTGTVRWKHAVGEGYRLDDKSNLASPSPVTDGERVIFFFATGDLVAFDFSGKEIWKTNVQKDHGRFAIQWTYASSLMLADQRLYVQVLQRNESFEFAGVQKGEKDNPNDSYILALDPKTGKQIWKIIRPSDAVAESREAFTTPIPFTHAGRAELLITGGDAITGHDPATGTELWRWSTWNPQKIGHWRLVTSPVGGDGIVLACAPKREPIYAFKAGGKGVLGESDIAWISNDDERKEVSSDVCTPAFYKGRFFIVNGDRQSIACVEPATGKVLWDQRIEPPDVRLQKIESSPTVADGKLYVMDHRGTVIVVAAADTFELLGINQMGSDQEQEVRSTIALANGHLLIRSNGKLYCVGKKF